jgi:hypothetical protein
MLLTILGGILIGGMSPVAGQDEPLLTEEYDENLSVYILKTGDTIYHWDIYDQGVTLDFPIPLYAPNVTSASLLDGEVVLTVIQSGARSQEMGLFASQYGGYMYNDLPGAESEYGFSHLLLQIDMQFDDLANITDGFEWVANVTSRLETAYGVDFLQFYNGTHSGTWWETQYRAFPSDQTEIWDSLLDLFPCGETLLSTKTRFTDSTNKAIRLEADWDEYDPTPDSDESELRWEFTADVELLESNTLTIAEGGSNEVNFQKILGYTGDFLMPTWVDDANLDIYLYKGAEITSVYPETVDDGQNRAHIYREMERDGDLLGTFAESANFVFTDAKESEPILACVLTTNSTTVSNGEDLLITRTVTNVGGQTAYNIDFYEPYDDLISTNNFDLISGDLFTPIETLAPGVANSSTAVLRLNSSADRTREYQFWAQYDATADPTEANHWSEPQNGDAQFTTVSNRIQTFQNDDGSDIDPWMIVTYEVSDYHPLVGDVVNISATIQNIGETQAENVEWQFNPFPNGGYTGLNTSVESGVIPSIDAGSSANVSVLYKVDVYNRHFGGLGEISCDLEFDEYNTTDHVVMDSSSIYFADTGMARFLIYPNVGQNFGPQLDLSVVLTAPTTLVGDKVSVDFSITNVGDSPAYNVYPTASYRDGNEVFYIEFYSGIDLGINLDVLHPGETVYFTARMKLLTAVAFEDLSIAPHVRYTIRDDDSLWSSWTCIATPLQILEIVEGTKLSGQTIWMIIALSAIAIIAGESVILYRKIKMI